MLFHPTLTCSPFLAGILDEGSFQAVMKMQIIYDLTISAQSWGRLFENLCTEPWFTKCGLHGIPRYLEMLRCTQQVRKVSAANLAVIIGALKLFHIRPQHIDSNIWNV